MIDPNKLEQLQEIFDKYKTDEIVGVWTDGVIEAVVFSDVRDYESIDLIMDKVIELFNIDDDRASGGLLETKFMERFKSEEGYYVE